MQLVGPFADRTPIAPKYTGEREDHSPELKWFQAPENTRTFALICDDPDAPSPRQPAPDPWVHWVIFNVPAVVKELPEGIDRVSEPPQVPGSRQGLNSWPQDNVGYRGPMPPPGSGKHRYFFKLYALDTELDLPAGKTTKRDLLSAIQGHVLAEAELVGTYERA